MIDFGAARSFLATQLTGASLGMNVYPSLAEAKSLPFAVLGNVESVEYQKTFGGLAKITAPLWVIVPRNNEAAAVAALDTAISIGTPGSVYSAIRTVANATNAPWRSLVCLSSGPYGSATHGNAQALAVSFNLT